MTQQIKDEFRYRKTSLLLVASNGSGLFDPAQYGITPYPRSTNCWQGYYCTYEVEGRALLLTKVTLSLGDEDEAAVARGEGLLFGKVPQQYTELSWEFKIDDIREPIPFTGGLLVGDDRIYETYIHMVLHPGYGRKTVHELVFDSGRLIEEHDRSAQMAEFRKMLSSRPLESGSQASRTEIEEQIKRCFSLEYEALL